MPGRSFDRANACSGIRVETLRIHPAFLPDVVWLEAAIERTALDVYGLVPDRVYNASTYRCRPLPDSAERISEHALGNAIDVSGLELPNEAGLERVRLLEHWDREDLHDRFFRSLARAVLREGPFRGVIGPPTEDHRDHFHFDHGRARYIALEVDPLPDPGAE